MLPLGKEIKESLKNNSLHVEIATNLKLNLQNNLKKWLSLSKEDKPFAFKASFLDPRFKNFLQPNKQQRVIYELSSKVTEITNICATSCASNNSDVSDVAVMSQAETLQFDNNQLLVSIPAVDQLVSYEIDNYLAEPVVDETEDPLRWWRNKQLQYRRLAMLARKYLCCSASCCCAQNSYLKQSSLQPFPSGQLFASGWR